MSSSAKHPRSSDPLLAQLARLYGVLPSYRDSRGVLRESSIKSIYQVLAALGAAVDVDQGDAPGKGRGSGSRRGLERAIGLRDTAVWERMIDPVLVAWEGVPGPTVLRLPATGPEKVDIRLVLEDGSVRERDLRLSSLRKAGEETMGGRAYTAWWLPRGAWNASRTSLGAKDQSLPVGYHRLVVEHGGRRHEATVISAPRRCWTPDEAATSRSARPWGVFAPLYGLRSDRDWGVGDLMDLEWLAEQVADQDGSAIATLPLLASYLDTPFEPAPYRPVSRLFWNEFYLAPEGTVEWTECPPAREYLQSAAVQAEVAALRAAPLVDYRAVAALKRRALESLSECFFEGAGVARRRSFLECLAAHPDAAEYAAFRADAEVEGADWRDWITERRPGRLAAPDSKDPRERYHLYCQWQMHEQLARVAGPAGAQRPGGCAGLFLDVPVGVHPGGFDTWKWRDAFLHTLSTGAPPDAFFALGQRWDTPPPHPDRAREQGHAYLVAYLRAHMRHAAYLRIDHFMGLHRLFCIPEGSDASEGVYVAYPAEEQYAVLCLESHRNRTIVVGEDLGTVPAGVRADMRRHGVLGTWVLQLSLSDRARKPVSGPSQTVVAAVNTHDTFPFAGFLQGEDIAARLETGQVDPGGARRELAARRRLAAKLDAWLPGPPPAAPGLLTRALRFLAGSKAAFVLVNLEDLWGEKRPQNQPGTGAGYGNWQRKLAVSRREVGEAVARAARAIGAGPPAARGATPATASDDDAGSSPCAEPWLRR
jgi:4-alpha-glucanotransferase